MSKSTNQKFAFVGECKFPENIEVRHSNARNQYLSKPPEKFIILFLFAHVILLTCVLLFTVDLCGQAWMQFLDQLEVEKQRNEVSCLVSSASPHGCQSSSRTIYTTRRFGMASIKLVRVQEQNGLAQMSTLQLHTWSCSAEISHVHGMIYWSGSLSSTHTSFTWAIPFSLSLNGPCVADNMTPVLPPNNEHQGIIFKCLNSIFHLISHTGGVRVTGLKSSWGFMPFCGRHEECILNSREWKRVVQIPIISHLIPLTRGVRVTRLKYQVSRGIYLELGSAFFESEKKHVISTQVHAFEWTEPVSW